MKVLVAEDDPNTLKGLVSVLLDEGYEVVGVADGEAAVAAFTEEQPQMVCLDVMMPKQNGYDVCREIRRQDPQVPILFISAKSEEIDKVLGLELGADDFIVKPFGVKEVLARIRAITRRCFAAGRDEAALPVDEFTISDLRVLAGELRAFRGKDVIELGLRDIGILKLFAENQGRVLSRDQIFDRCWGANYFPQSRSLDQHISQLRKKIERDPKCPNIIETVHGAGYRYPMGEEVSHIGSPRTS